MHPILAFGKLSNASKCATIFLIRVYENYYVYIFGEYGLHVSGRRDRSYNRVVLDYPTAF